MLIDGKNLFEIPIKNEEETHEQIIEMERKNDYTTGNLLDYEYFYYQCSKQGKLIAIDLSRQIELENPDLKQQINSIGRLKVKPKLLKCLWLFRCIHSCSKSYNSNRWWY